MKKIILLILFGLYNYSLFAQKIKMSQENLEANQVHLSFVKMNGKDVVKVEADTTIKGTDEATIVKLKGSDFQNGTIEVKILSRLMKNAPAFARGFIGVAFRIGEKNEKFESIYIRPTNGRADDQIRRNHSIQYFAFPDYRFDKLRKTDPEKYESYADMALNEWITMRIEVEGKKAKLYLHNNKQPSLIVNDLKLGNNSSGGIGLWIGNFTEGYFKDLKITKK
jgi:hypothetical protein